MADPTGYTQTSNQSNLIESSVDRYVRAALRHTPLLRAIADTRPVQVDKPGESVRLYTYSDLAVATTPLSETADPDAVALSDPTATTIALNEYGLSTIATIRAKKFAFSDIDQNQLDQVAYSQRNTLDVLVRDVVSAGSNVLYSGNATSTASVDNADVFSSDDVRQAVTTLRRNAAMGKRGDLYGCWLHPDVAFDLRKETDAAGWRMAHINAAPDLVWPGEIGVYEGAFFVETARMKVAADGTDATPDANVYRTIFAGKEALAEAVSIEPGARVGVVPDKLNRFYPLGWYGLLGWSIFRQEALVRVESGSSFNA
jgi:N4-gp56 family major capsid protein